MEPQAFDVLVYLVEHRERVVSKEELMDSIWGGRFVTEAAVTSRIKQVRRALGDDGGAQRLIRTVHGRGYRFIGEIADRAETTTATLPDSGVTGATPGLPEPQRQPPQMTSPGNHNLVGSVNRLIGREAELAMIAAAVNERRLVTILGTGGMGKSRLALEVARARHDADGPWFIELAGLTDGSLLAETISTALGIPSAGDVRTLAGVLRERHLLLVLDNCEQIADEAAGLVNALLERSPYLHVLATSRQTLGAQGELVVDLRPLSAPEAEELFIERAAAVVPGWTPDHQEHAVLARLCRGLDHLPLAIELAAAQCRALSVRQLAEQLGDRFALLGGGRRGNHRHASMMAAVAWSYDTLSTEEQRLFESLCLLEGSFDLEGVAAASGEGSGLAVLLSLIDKSLVTVLEGSPRRYRILETLRQFAAQRRPEARTREVEQRIVAWVSSMADRADVELQGPRSREWMQRLDQDKETIRAALTWCADDQATELRIAVGMVWFWYRRGHTVEALRALRPLSATSAPSGRGSPASPESDSRIDLELSTLPSSLLVRGAVGVLLLHYLAGDYEQVPGQLEFVKAVSATTDDEAARSYALATAAYFEAGGGQIDQALTDAGAALDIALRISSDQHATFSLMCMGMAHLRAGAAAEAEKYAAEAVSHADACGYAWGAVASSWIMCKAKIATGDFSTATVAGLARVITESADNRDLTSWLVGLVSEAFVLLKRGDVRQAAEMVGIANRQGQLIGFAPEAMDPVETRQFLAETMRCIEEQELTTQYEQGRSLDTDRAFARITQLLEEALP
jgi:predicted ATPase/DNA-binding winged helix-turn-helix (wHTH) protein